MSHFCAVWMEHLLSWLFNSLKRMCSSAETISAWQFGNTNFSLFIQQWNKWLISFVLFWVFFFPLYWFEYNDLILHSVTVKAQPRNTLWIHLRRLSFLLDLSLLFQTDVYDISRYLKRGTSLLTGWEAAVFEFSAIFSTPYSVMK